MTRVRRDVEAGGRRRRSRDALASRPEVERLLDAARAPASSRELAGEHAAVDLFVRTRPVPPATAAPTPSRAARRGLKAAMASVVAVGAMSSGVAFATTGHVPFVEQLKQATRKVIGPGSDDRSPGSHDRTSHERGTTTTPNGPKAAALPVLCRAFAHSQQATHGHALDARPFTALVTAAGGAGQVEDFCASLSPGTRDKGADPSHPRHSTHPTRPGGRSSQAPSTSESPSAHPGHPSHPSHPTQGNTPTHMPKPTHSTHRTRNPRPTQQPHATQQPHHTQRPHTTTQRPHPTHLAD